MTLKELREKKLDLKKKIQEARTEGDLEIIKEELLALQKAEEILQEQIDSESENEDTTDEENKDEESDEDEEENPADEENEEELVDERSLIKKTTTPIPAEKRNMNDIKILKKVEENNMDEMNILASAEYRSAFLKRLQGKALNEAEKRAMTTAVESVGAGIPTTLLNKIEEKLRQTSALFNEVEVLNLPRILKYTKGKCNKRCFVG
ncbi:MAG: hypothetical protein IKI57_03675 [Clostridia bacterium]|nr:hypothetical protein [Clostridia bacterium]